MKKFRTLLILLVLSLIFAGCQSTDKPVETATTTSVTEAVTEPTIAIEPIDKTVFVWEDFSAVKSGKTTFEELCRLIPLTKQLQTTMYNTVGYYPYPTEDGGSVRIYFTTESETVSAIAYYPGENSEYYPVKDISVFSFIVPGETSMVEVIERIPHPDYYVPALSSLLIPLDYEMADGSVVYVYFDQLSRIVHHLELEKDGVRETME